MTTLRLQISGTGDTWRVAEALRALLGEEVAVEPAPAPSIDGAGTVKKVDRIAVAALILSIPSSLLALDTLMDRLDGAKKEKAAQLIEVGGKLTVEHRVEIHVMTDRGPMPLEDLTPEQLLDLAKPSDPER